MNFQTVFAKHDIIDRENEKVRNHISGKEKLCTPLYLSCHQECGKYGIWLDIKGDVHLLVHPIDLFNSIFKEERIWVDSVVENGVKNKSLFQIEVFKEPYIYSWSLYHEKYPEYGRNYHTKETYINTVQKVLSELLEKMEKGFTTAYTQPQGCAPIGIDTIRMCLRQFAFKATFPSNYMLRTSDIVEESFVFEPKGDEEYIIGIGDRTFRSFLEHWDNDMEYIRHQFETCAYHKEAVISLNCDFSETTIKLTPRSIIDETNESDSGVGFKYKDYLLVEIVPNSSEDKPVIRGFCDVKKTIRTFYEGLLQMALRHSCEESNDDKYPQNLVVYNRYKSLIIESALDEDQEYVPNTYSKRQSIIKDVVTIDPDYDVFLWIASSGAATDSFDNYYDRNGNPISFPEMIEWAREVSPIVVSAGVGEPYEKDWADYHKRGLELAHRLRNILSDDFDLWYSAPFEDKSGTIPKPILICSKESKSLQL